MPQNLVQGGARRGWFQTRQTRLVHLTEPFEFTEPLQPGRPAESRTCWRGMLYLSDGKTPDTAGIWESSGAFQAQNGVSNRNDLAALVSLDPEETVEQKEPLTALAAASTGAGALTAFDEALQDCNRYRGILHEIAVAVGQQLGSDPEHVFATLPAIVRSLAETKSVEPVS